MNLIKNKTFESYDFNIQNKETKFENCAFKLSFFNITDSKIIFSNCRFFCSVYIENSACTFSDCEFSDIEDNVLNIENNSLCEISGCNFNRNGSLDVLNSQILISDSKLNIKDSSLENGINSNGLEALNSKISIRNTTVSENEGCGVLLHGCAFDFKSFNVKGNGRNGEDFTQVYIHSSNGELVDFAICEGINSGGIVITSQSECLIKNGSICRHKKNGLSIERYSVLNMSGCSIYENGNEFEETMQVWVDNSKLKAKNCSINSGVCGVYAQKGAYISLFNCDIKNNIGGVCIFESSEIALENCFVLNNASKAQLWLEGSKAAITNTKIADSDCCRQLHAEDMEILSLKNTNIKKDGMIIKNCRNLEIEQD